MIDAPSAEDEKLLTLARAARARIGAAAGAAVRDDSGRNYTGAEVAFGAATLTATTLAASQALAAGAESFEAVALVADDPRLQEDEVAALAPLGPRRGSLVVWLATPDGTVRDVWRLERP